MNLMHQQFATMEGMDGPGLNGLDGLDGWGKLKKKLGLNKLKTRKLVGKVAKVVPGAALLSPTKKNLKQAGKGLAIGAAIGSAVVGGPKAVAAAKKIAKQVKASQAKKDMEARAKAEIERQAAAYAAELEQADAPAMTSSGAGGSYAEPATTTGTDDTDAPKKAGWILPAGLVTTALLAMA